MAIDLVTIRRSWLAACGVCDVPLGDGCGCPANDPRPLIAMMCNEIESLRVSHAALVTAMLQVKPPLAPTLRWSL